MQVHRLRMLFFTLAVAGLSACGNHSFSASNKNTTESSGPVASFEIIGGVEATEKTAESSSVVMIYGISEEGFTQICTGTFISQSVVLTAGHCVPEQVQSLRLTFKRVTSAGQVVKNKLPVVQVLRHESYKKSDSERNDLALIQFSGGLPVGAKVALLALKNQITVTGTRIVALGYGRSDDLQGEDESGHGEGTLRRVEQTTVAEFRDQFGFVVNQENGKGVCFGDSGGPAFLNNSNLKENAKLLGVASAVYSEAEEDAEHNCSSRSLYMSVAKYRDWILAGMVKLKVGTKTKE